MNPAQRARRMVEYLPPLLQSGGRIHRLFDAIAQELGVMEGGLTRLMRSRWYMLAAGFRADDSLAVKAGSELGRMGALYGLQPGPDEGAAYFRRRLASMVALHREGLGTAPALLRLVSMVYRAEQPPELFWDGDTAVGRFTVPEPPDASGAPRSRTLTVELHDNPSTAATARFQRIPANQRLLTFNQGLDPALPEIELTAPPNSDIRIPILHHHGSGLDVLFLGSVPRGKTLTLRHQRKPQINGIPASEPVLLAHPARFDDTPQPIRFDTETARFSVFDPYRGLPALAPGENHWSHGTLSKTDLANYLPAGRNPELEEARGKALELALEPKQSQPIDIRFHWTEVTPATFALRIPVDYVPPQAESLPDLVRELTAALNYGRVSGVRARIEFMLTMPREVFAVSESPAQVALESRFAEPFGVNDSPVSDTLTSFGPAIDFEEQLPEPEDRLSWSGFFDTTRFNTSRFDK
ncbi:hypothetical protein [Comamonas sp. JC664]|uniref:hypothetical protein n=1 Tax=Comamonas sp. JC664 TaxID=2801917 RepID=UPI00174935FD|nr:hypothetical protein [Comamonas sp. JC664]MBL0692174.1 hypothetical protein [Comamonas sp. JC664]GHG99760.1 hypothetical protein GCM10012319_66380 [Comamonas sp. KCTC 72670]